MTRIVIEPAPLELGLNRDAYEALVSDLKEGGFDAELRPPVEERFDLPQEIINASLWLGEQVRDGAVDAILAMFLSRMWRSRRRLQRNAPKPVVRIYGPSEEVLREVEIPERDD